MDYVTDWFLKNSWDQCQLWKRLFPSQKVWNTKSKVRHNVVNHKTVKFGANKIQTSCRSTKYIKWFRRVTFHPSRQHSTLLNARQSITELRVICAVARYWGQADLPASWSHLDSSETVTKGRNNGTTVGNHRDIAAAWSSRNTSVSR